MLLKLQVVTRREHLNDCESGYIYKLDTGLDTSNMEKETTR